MMPTFMERRYEAQSAPPDAPMTVTARELFALLNLVRLDREVYRSRRLADVDEASWNSARYAYEDAASVWGVPEGARGSLLNLGADHG